MVALNSGKEKQFLALITFLRWVAMAAFGLLLLGHSYAAEVPEYRAFWASAYQDGFKTPEQVTKMIAEIRAVNCNEVIVEVRKRGDAYYNSTIEAKALDIAPDFDPLADIIKKAHDTNSGPRIEVHAWVVAYPVWGDRYLRPSQPSHPYLKHPDWLTKDTQGEKWYVEYYSFDPGHPEVQKYLFDVCMEIISRYDVDGLQLDHIRYDRNNWGYNDTTVARFNERFHRTGPPPIANPQWDQFRRDQVTDLVRKIYISAIAIKPQVKLSAACNTRAPGISQLAEWPKGAPYFMLLQDWRAWMEEGIIDIAIDLAYFRQQQWASAWDKWSTFAKDNRYNRHAVYSPGPFINSVADSLYQIHSTRMPTAKGNRVDGVALYCYAVTSNDGVSRDTFLKALTQPSRFDPIPVPVFARPTSVPEMTWKTKPTKGSVKGFVYDAKTKKTLDYVTVSLNGPMKKSMVTDATGFYGAIELPVGHYAVTATSPAYNFTTNSFEVKAGVVATVDLLAATH